MKLHQLVVTLDSIMIVFCIKKIVIVTFFTLFCDQECLFQRLEIN